MPLTTITVSIKADGAMLGPKPLPARTPLSGALGKSVVLFVYEQLRATAPSQA
jgi:hypothetical protein